MTTPQERIFATIKKHEKLTELVKKLNPFGKITEVIFNTVSDVLAPAEKILLCFYQIQIGQKYMDDGSSVPRLSSCELCLITDRNFIRFSFLLTHHSIKVRNVDNICNLNFNILFGDKYDLDEEIGAEEKSFTPTQLQITYDFANQKGEKIDSWELDIMDEPSIQMMLPQTKYLSQFVGTPLKNIQLG
jgi:hypothetical protein